jgi:hypothetical protein
LLEYTKLFSSGAGSASRELHYKESGKEEDSEGKNVNMYTKVYITGETKQSATYVYIRTNRNI